MRTLILYVGDDGIDHCGCIIHDGTFNPIDEADTEWQDQLTEWTGTFVAVNNISDQFADSVTVTDDNGQEIGKQYIQR